MTQMAQMNANAGWAIYDICDICGDILCGSMQFINDLHRMPSFFRTLSNNLRPEHRLTKLLVGGIGEILMVMVGILLALQVNNWNDDRKDGVKELKILREMRVNLDRDLADCRFNIERSGQLLRANQAVLKQLDDRTLFHDSLRIHYGNIFGNTQLTANTSAYDNLKSIGFNLIRNDSLRQMITTLYSERYTYLRNLEFEADGKLQFDHILPQLLAKVVVDTVWESGHPIDPEALMEDASFKGLLRMNMFIRAYMIDQYQGVEQRVLALQAMIDQEVAARE